ncbi:hypothetical protein Tco_1212499 [Tanacetum coccineum]
MSTLAEFMIVVCTDNRPPMLDKPQYESWKSRMEIYIQEDDTVRLKIYEELSDKEKLQADCDLKGTNIVLQGLSPDVYALVNHHKIAKDIWDRVKLLIQGTSLSRQERECKLYHEFDKFSHVKVNTKFLNSLPPEWGKFVTNVKLARDLHTSKYDQLYAYLKQHEARANEARLMRERFPDPLALVANYHQPPTHFNNYHSQYTTPQYQQQLSPPTQHPSLPENAYPPSTIPQQPQAEFPQIDLGLAVPTFLPGDDPIACMNKAMEFLSAMFSPHYPPTNNQPESSSNTRNQATVQDGRVTVKQRLSSAITFKRKGIWLDSVLSQSEEGMLHGLREMYCLFKHRLRTDDLDAYDSDCDDISSAKAVLMANLLSCDSDVLSEVPYSDTSQNDMMNQSVQELQYSELSHIVDYPDNEITSDSNIIPYSQYLEEMK